MYEVDNTHDRTMTGAGDPELRRRSRPAQYFNKLECFCFTQQTLAAGRDAADAGGVRVDPKLPKDVTTITLSYTFFEVDGNRKATRALAARDEAARPA